MAETLLSPRDCLCFNLRRAARRITQGYDRALRPAGMTATQFNLLAMIEGHARDDGIALSALAEHLGMDRTTLTRTLALVERAGWVETGPGTDRRERRIRLTDPGRVQLGAALPLWRKQQRKMVSALGPVGTAAIRALSERL